MASDVSSQPSKMSTTTQSLPSKVSSINSEELIKNLNLDPYDEEQAELRFLHSKPTCFIILGKPGSGKTTLAQKLAQEWKCQLVNAHDVLMEHVEMQTEVGVKINELLIRGEAIPEEMVAKIIEEKINSPEVAHHGYILDDFPSLCEDYMSIKDQLELVTNWKLKPDFIINMKIPDKDLEVRRIGQKVDPLTGEIYTKDVYDPEKPPPKEKDDKGEDEEEEEEEEELEDEEEDEESSAMSAETLARLIRRPEDLPENVEAGIAAYKEKMLRLLEDYMADHDQQFLIELDGNKPIKALFPELLSRLGCFVLRPAAVPMRLQDEEEELPEDVDTEELMRSLAPKRFVAPRFRWRRSRWLRYCPVALAEGNLIPGKPEFAVSFLDKMYVLSSEEAMGKFLKNPRPFLLPPQPRPPCKLVVLGHPLSGKTTMCNLLAEKYGATVINMEESIKPKIEEEKTRVIEQVREDATTKAIADIKKKIQEQMELEAEAREAAATTAGTTEGEGDTTAAEETSQGEEKTSEEDDDEKEKSGEEDDDEKEKSGEEDEEESKKSEEKIDEVPQEKSESEVEDGSNTDLENQPSDAAATTVAEDTIAEKAEEETTAQDDMSTTIPSTTRVDGGSYSSSKEEAVVVDASHPDVAALVEAAVEAAQKQEVTLVPEIWIDAMEAAIEEAEKKTREAGDTAPLQGGWILDNFPRTRDQWNVLSERAQDKAPGAVRFIPDEVLYLADMSENGQYLLHRWYHSKRGEIDAAIVQRTANELAEKKRKEAEEEAERKKKEEEERRAAEEAARKAAEEAAEEGEEGAVAEKGKLETVPEIAVEPTVEEPKPNTAEVKSESEGKAVSEEEKASALDIPMILVEKASTGEVGGDEDGKQVEEGSVSSEAPPETDVRSATPDEDKMPPEGPELEAQKELRKLADAEWNNANNTISGSLGLEPMTLEICFKPEEGTELEKRTQEQLMEEITENMEKVYKYSAWEMTGADLDEDEEDMAAEQEEEEEEAEEEEEDPNRNVKKMLGDTNFYCPVALKETGVFWPGNPEIAVKYREKNYYLSTADNRDKFLADPDSYLPKNKPFEPPAIRLLILGPMGAGKSLHGRYLAKKLGLFHIQWRERLQELVIAKTKKKLIGPDAEEEGQEDEEPEEDEDEDEDESAGITNPDGSKYDDSDNKDEDGDSADREDQDEIKGEEEEEEQVELTEDEDAISNYLKDDEPLGQELMDKIVMDWWHKEPFKSTGFILEGFPRNQDEAMYLQEQGLFPDAAVLLVVEDSDVVGRLLPPKMDRWKIKRQRKIARREKKKEKAKKKREAAIQKRREELTKEVEKRKAERKAQREAEREEDEDAGSEEEEEEEEEEEDDIDAILADEFEEEEEEEEMEEETEEEASERMQNDLAEIYDKDTNNLSNVQEKLEELLVPRLELEAGRKPHIVRYQLGKKLRRIVEYRHSVFERVYPIPERLAIRMMQTGYKQPSRFGRWCPVKLHEGEVLQPMHGPSYQTFPALYRSFIYFLSTAANRELFILDPMTYLTQPSPKPVVPIRIAIIGPPKSGKTTLARRFAEEYGCMRLSMGEAIRMVLETQRRTYLAQAIRQHLNKGLTVPDELAVRALEVAVTDMRCTTRGFILDGVPISRRITELMAGRGLVPVRVVDLQLSSHEVVTRATKDRYSPDRVLPLHDSAQILTVKLAAWLKEIDGVREYYQSEHDNLVAIDASRSKWWVWKQVLDVARESVTVIQTYVGRIQEGKAACIGNMCITPSDFDARLGDFEQYCPVSLALRGELVDCTNSPSLKYAVEFRGHYYKTAGPEELAAFLEEPEQFVPPLAPRKLPPADMLPKRRSAEDVKNMFPKQIELKGYCPVTFKNGKMRYESIVPGDQAMVVEYQDKLYTMTDEKCLDKFMRRPEDYWDLQLPHKLPPRPELLSPTGLPMLGYMEQTVAQAVIKALTQVGNLKPKYPFLSSSRSAEIYIGYHLKAYNPKSSEYVRKKYKRKLLQFEETCELIKYLGDNMSKKYKEPTQRPIDFDFKLDKFMALKEITPSATALTWVM